MFDLDRFISDHVTKRQSSMFLEDLQQNREKLQNKIQGKTQFNHLVGSLIINIDRYY